MMKYYITGCFKSKEDEDIKKECIHLFNASLAENLISEFPFEKIQLGEVRFNSTQADAKTEYIIEISCEEEKDLGVLTNLAEKVLAEVRCNQYDSQTSYLLSTYFNDCPPVALDARPFTK